MELENLTPDPEQQQPTPTPPQPQYQPPQPQYQPPQPQYQPPQPQYQPPQPQYQPPQPQYQPPQLQYQPPQPQYQPPQYRQYPQPQEPKKKTAAWKIVVPIVAGVLVLAVLACVYFFFLRSTPPEKLELSETSLYLRPEEGYELYFTFEPADAEFEYAWTSSDPSVATVENGGVTAVGEGNCVITLQTEDGLRADCQVVVEAAPPEAENVVGTWRFNGATIDGEPYNVGEANVTLYVYADHTGDILIEGVKTAFVWEYTHREDGVEHYAVQAEDGTLCDLLYYGDLTLYGDDANIINFTR